MAIGARSRACATTRCASSGSSNCSYAKIGSPASKTFGQLRVGMVSTVMATPGSEYFIWALAVANRDAIVAPARQRHVSGRILIFRLAGRVPLLGCTGAIDVAVDWTLEGTATHRSRNFRLEPGRGCGLRG